MKSKLVMSLSRKGGKKPGLCVLLLCAMVCFVSMSSVMAVDTPITNAAQQIVVTGVVTDAQGEAIPGANVIVLGTTTGVATDVNGAYSVRVPNTNSVIQYSYMGFNTQEVTVGNQSVINVKLDENIIKMEEVVVTALGMKRQTKALSYSATEVKGDDLGQTADLNLMNALQGKIAGVSIDVSGSQIGGAGANIVIRGTTTVSGSGSPMYVVDGMPASSADLTSINPSDIESMNVMKGAAATALYGSRASNGLIIITTKKGQNRRGIGISYSGRVGIESYENPYKNRQKEWGTSDGSGGSSTYPTKWNWETHRSWGPKFDGRKLGIYFNDDPDNYPEMTYAYKEDHWKEFMRTGYNYNNSLAFSGGNDKQQFRFSASDYRYESPIPNASMTRQTFNLSTHSQFGERITLDAGIRYNKTIIYNNPSDPARYMRILGFIPSNWDINWLKGSYGKMGAEPNGTMLAWSTNDYYPNPWWTAYQEQHRSTESRINAYGSLRYDIFDWLYINGRIQLNHDDSYGTDIQPYGGKNSYGDGGKGRVTEASSYTDMIDADWSLVMDKTFGDFEVNALFGGALTRSRYERAGIQGGTLIIPFYHVVTNATASTYSPQTGFTKSGMNSLYGSVEVSYKNYLYLTATGRNDWFSSLNPDMNSLFYPSVGLSYIISNHLKLPEFISFAKLRASWANVGGGTSAYATKFGYTLSAAGYMQNPTLSIPGSIPNKFIKPYRTREWEVGADIRFLNNRIGVDYAYYDKETTDDIVNASIPESSGYTSTKVNLGAISNKGHELALTFVPINNDLRWDLTLVYSHNRSKILDLGGASELTLGSTSAGTRISVKQVVGQKANGIYAYTQKRTETGEKVWERANFSTYGVNTSTWRQARSAAPELVGFGGNPNMASLTTTWSWKGFTLSAMIDARWGGTLVYASEYENIERGTSGLTIPGRDGGLFLEGVYDAGGGVYKDVKDFPAYVVPAPAPGQNSGIDAPFTVQGNEVPYKLGFFERFYRYNSIQRSADMITFDADYVKLREVSLGYTVPRSWLQKLNLPIQSARVSIVGRNVLNIYKDLEYGDPSTVRGNTGVSNFALPSLKSYTFNLDINF